ncbi:MAG: LTA synthase family protein [Clostridium sartagoforme]|nr:LTA synthase family protein [Clostridium sartagoforme]
MGRKILKKYKWIEIILIILYIKSFLFALFITFDNGIFNINGVGINIFLILPHLAILGVLVLPALMFKGKNSIKYLLFIDIIYSILIILDLWVYRGNGHLLELKFLFFNEGFYTLNKGIFNPRIIDIIFLIDIYLLLSNYKKISSEINHRRKVGTSILLIALCFIIIGTFHYVLDIKDLSNGKVRFIQEEWQGSWNPYTKIVCRSPIGNHVYEDYKTIKKLLRKTNDNDIEEINEWLAWNNEELEDNEYKGLASGKNIIFLQIEALENFVINEEIFGQEITPNLNKLTNNSLYFKNIHEQNNAGNSIDMDMMASSGVLPLGDVITYLEYPEVKYYSLPRLLNQEGYNTILTHAEKAGDWNWAEAGKAAAGYKTIWDIRDYTIDERVGFGLSDRSLYTQFVDKVSREKEPFLAVVPTLTSHGPFNIDDEYRELDLPKELDENRLGGYFQSIHYADKQIGLFFELLKEKELLDNTIVVIYGDHGGVHKYYMEDVEASNIEGSWWQKRDSKIPLIICGSNVDGKTIETYGGQVDIMPTVAYLLGVDTKGYVMGRNLLNTNRDVTVIKDGIVVGNPKGDEEEMFKKAYDIADKIIKNNYYYITKKVD